MIVFGFQKYSTYFVERFQKIQSILKKTFLIDGWQNSIGLVWLSGEEHAVTVIVLDFNYLHDIISTYIVDKLLYHYSASD